MESPKFKVGQYWLGLSIGEPRHSFVRKIISMNKEAIRYRFWSSTEHYNSGEYLYSTYDWSTDRWNSHLEKYRLTSISNEKAIMLIQLWGFGDPE